MILIGGIEAEDGKYKLLENFEIGPGASAVSVALLDTELPTPSQPAA
jgi:hypothetical protein